MATIQFWCKFQMRTRAHLLLETPFDQSLFHQLNENSYKEHALVKDYSWALICNSSQLDTLFQDIKFKKNTTGELILP